MAVRPPIVKKLLTINLNPTQLSGAQMAQNTGFIRSKREF
jgi:hypothetical protein